MRQANLQDNISGDLGGGRIPSNGNSIPKKVAKAFSEPKHTTRRVRAFGAILV